MMKKNLNSILSVILSFVIVISSVIFSGYTYAVVTTPLSSSGSWQHRVDTEYTDGRGTNYISMGVDGLNFYFTQTEDNEEMTFHTELWAMKNDGVNNSTLNSVSLNDARFTPSWSLISSQSVSSTPANINLPGSFGSGYANQVSKNLCRWACDYTFTANGAATYTPVMDIYYTGAGSAVSSNDFCTTTDGEPVNFSINVCDVRKLVSLIAEANKQLNAENSNLTNNEKAIIQDVLNNVENDYVLDGSEFYKQTAIDELSNTLLATLDADYSDYLEQLKKAEKILNSTMYSDAEKSLIRDEIINKDDILSKKVIEQAAVDEATESLYNLIDSMHPDNMGTPNKGNSESTSEEIKSSFYYAVSGSTDVIDITINHQTVYLDITENLSDTGLTWTYYSSFNNIHNVSAPLSSNCLGASQKNGINGTIQPTNFTDYFSNYGQGDYVDCISLNLLPSSTNGGGPQTVTVALDGVPTQTTDGAKIYLGYYWKQYKTTGTTYSRWSYSDFNLSEGYDLPYFTVVIYDKAPLAAAIDVANDIIRTDAVNRSEYLALVANATEIYNTREVTPTQIQEAMDSLKNFVFTYEVDMADNTPNSGNISVALVSGTEVANNVYTDGSVVTITANAESGDYTFTGWSDGVTDNPRTVNVEDKVNFTAEYDFVSADYDALNEAISDFESSKQIYSDENAKAIQDLIDSFNMDLGRTSQATVDTYLTSLNALIEVTPAMDCEYIGLDQVIKLTRFMPNNNENGFYSADAWQTYINALDAANTIDRNLKVDIEGKNQQLIYDTSDALYNAYTALNSNSNHNAPCDYSELNEVIDDSKSLPETNTGKYTDEAWNAYQESIEKANEISKDLYDDTDGNNQKLIDETANALSNALKELEDTANCTVEIKDENGDTTEIIYIEKDTTFGDIKDGITPDVNEDETVAGFIDENGNKIEDDTIITGDMTIIPVVDVTKLIPDTENGTLMLDNSTGYYFMGGIDTSHNTVGDIKNQLVNENVTIIVVRDGVELDDNALVGTNCKVLLVSKLDHSIIYEEATIILYGDVNGDGLIDDVDHSIVKVDMMKPYTDDCGRNLTLGSIWYVAADTDKDTALDCFDYFNQDREMSGFVKINQTLDFSWYISEYAAVQLCISPTTV